MTDALHARVIAALGHQYAINDEIGRGGMSVVYRARDLRLNRPVAIKVLPPELAYDPAIRARFRREAQTSAQLAHAHIVPIFDVGEQDDIAYFVMSIITGGNLGTLLAREPHQPIDEVRRILGEIADALSYAHLRGVIHRDIKPDNILLDGESGRAMVTDFGIARAMESGSRLTMTGNAVGTPTYMSPEQATGEREIDGRSDVYSLGVIGYQMLTGRVPFTAGNPMALLLKHVGEAPPPIAELRPDAPGALCAVIERALLKVPADRWPTAIAMREALAPDRAPGTPWRPEPREPVRYATPRPQSPRPDASPSPARRSEAAANVDVAQSSSYSPRNPRSGIADPPHLAALSPAQRRDLRLWHGHIGLHERVRAMRRNVLSAIAVTFGAFGIAGLGLAQDIPPLVIAPVISLFMTARIVRRARSLRESGVKMRRVLLMPRSRMALPTQPSVPTQQEMEKLAPRAVLESPHGAAIRRAAEDRAAIVGMVAALPKADRALLPDLVPTANALVERVASLAQGISRLEQSIDPDQARSIDSRIAEVEREGESAEGERRLALLRRQRTSLDSLVQRRTSMARQMDNAELALGNLRLDLIKVRSSGLQSAFSDMTSATQDARALSREIDTVIEAAAEARSL